MESVEQKDGATLDRHGDTKVESSTIIIKAWWVKKCNWPEKMLKQFWWLEKAEQTNPGSLAFLLLIGTVVWIFGL
jgi:hypothetical protein